MKILIFAGGSGTRLWPLSRENLPKQFKQMFEGKSTLQLMVDRVEKAFKIENIIISTNEKYVHLVKEQIPEISTSNIVAEPCKRDLAPAIGYNLMRLRKMGYKGPIAIVWADHLMKDVEEFLRVLRLGESLIKQNPERLVFVGEQPVYAENNLGWIHIGSENQSGIHEFVEWHYRPPVDLCKQMFESGEWLWNPGYFIVDVDYVLNLYQQFAHEMYSQLEQIAQALDTTRELEVLNEIYPQLEAASFDKKIIEKVPSDKALVIKSNMGWSDPGTLYALKAALVGDVDRNLTQGKTYEYETKDSLIINEDKGKLVVTMGLEGMVVVNTKDAMLVVHKDKVLEITKLIERLKEQEEFQKYI